MNSCFKKLIFVGLSLLFPFPVFAAAVQASTLPFVEPLQLIQQGISGPFLLSGAIVLIVVTCMTMAFGEHGEGFKRLLTIVFWLAMAFGAAGLINTLFGAVI